MLQLIVNGEAVSVQFRENPRARRMVMRLDPSGEGLIITMPRRASREKALAFAQSHSEWVREKLRAQPKRLVFCHGARFFYRGEEIEIVHEIGKRQAGRLEGQQLYIGGQPEHLRRRMHEWLKARAREYLHEAVQFYAASMGVRPGKITLRDTQSRWGSCSPDGALSFSWRLIFAPAHVLEYVAAHEVAHLLELNHGPRFWAHVEKHFPEHQKARDWLKTDGAHLHLIG